MRARQPETIALALVVVLGGALRAQGLRFGEVHRMVPPDADTTQAVALGDVDGDGDLDAFVANGQNLSSSGGEQNRLYLNDGVGVFADATTQLPAILDLTNDVALGDVDGDGDLDAFLASALTLGLSDNILLLNDGTGRFTDAPSQLPTPFPTAFGVALGDVDGDGDLDSFLAASLNHLYLNNGIGIFADATSQLPAGSAGARDVALGDLDGDGDLDALTASAGQNRLYLNNGAGVFANATALLPPDNDDTWSVALGDVDGDGDLDAWLGNRGLVFIGAQNRLYLNNGAGAFTDATSQIPAVLDNTRSVRLVDVDGDGDLDALIGNGGNGPLDAEQDRLHLNDGAGTFTDATAQLPQANRGTFDLAVGDLDGDGDPDVFVAEGLLIAGTQNHLRLNDGSGGFADSPNPIPSVLDDTWAVALEDVDGDGNLDALVGNYGGQNRLYLNDGLGGMTDATSQLPAVLDTTVAFGLGDVDADGDVDAFVGNGGSTSQPLRLLLNNGSGVFADATAQLPSILLQTTAIALGDVDGDGDLDALIGTGWGVPGQQDRLYLNDGMGTFTDATLQLPAILDDTWAVALGDVDADGDLDALVGNTGQDRLYLNNGVGVFALASFPFFNDDTRAVALGDLDGDGDLDAWLANGGVYPGSENRVFLNNGSGAFSSGWQSPGPGSARSVALGDADGDGDLDALVGYGKSALQSPQNRLYLNNGVAAFSLVATGLPAMLDDTRAVAFGDVDGDGDLDALIGNIGDNRLLMNLTRHLAWRGIPRLGKPLALDAWGPPSSPWTLAFSLAAANIPLAPLGTLRLDPTTLHPTLAGTLDAQGRGSATYAVPANAALLGIPVYWQALVGSPPRFTNLETTTATNL